MPNEDKTHTKSSIERFVESLNSEEKSLLQDYPQHKNLETLSKNFDNMVSSKHEAEEDNN